MCEKCILLILHAYSWYYKNTMFLKTFLQWTVFRKYIVTLNYYKQRRFSYLHHQTYQELHSSFLEHSFCASLWQSSNQKKKKAVNISARKLWVSLRLFLPKLRGISLVYLCVAHFQAPTSNLTSKLSISSMKVLTIYTAENKYKGKDF